MEPRRCGRPRPGRRRVRTRGGTPSRLLLWLAPALGATSAPPGASSPTPLLPAPLPPVPRLHGTRPLPPLPLPVAPCGDDLEYLGPTIKLPLIGPFLSAMVTPPWLFWFGGFLLAILYAANAKQHWATVLYALQMSLLSPVLYGLLVNTFDYVSQYLGTYAPLGA